ncbi:glycosyl hydrolase 108 family protein [Rhizobium leguminosarum]|uniref:glycosyl hydrolase 108 family protein n=1 Tax=Rhizobium leguminosarum TaxID=384 RepID=UPI00391966B6
MSHCTVRKTATAVGNLPSCLIITLKFEGGYSNDPNDRGNWTGQNVGVGILKGTKNGIAAHAYPRLDIKNLTLDETKSIYERDWKPILGDKGSTLRRSTLACCPDPSEAFVGCKRQLAQSRTALPGARRWRRRLPPTAKKRSKQFAKCVGASCCPSRRINISGGAGCGASLTRGDA